MVKELHGHHFYVITKEKFGNQRVNSLFHIPHNNMANFRIIFLSDCNKKSRSKYFNETHSYLEENVEILEI